MEITTIGLDLAKNVFQVADLEFERRALLGGFGPIRLTDPGRRISSSCWWLLAPSMPCEEMLDGDGRLD